jgi:N-acetylmuramoyl-L-alanine amidase
MSLKILALCLALSTRISAFCQEGPVVCIDPGHPSETSAGTRGRKITEIEIDFKIAEALAARLTKAGYRVTLTKSSVGEKVTNRSRAEIANSIHASLLLRLHCDASGSHTSGFALYYPANQGTTAGVTGPSAEVITVSALAGNKFYRAMKSSLSGKFPSLGLKTDRETAIGSKQGALTGSIFSKVPTVLVEMVVLTNPSDEQWILSSVGFQAMVDALEKGVVASVGR